MAQTFGGYKPPPVSSSVESTALTTPSLPGGHQERVNAEMFKAIEMLGRKLERADDERVTLQRRLALIESAATVDEKTGKLYLPVVGESGAILPPVTASATPAWMVGATLMSSAAAILALGLVLLRPATPALTPEQVAILNELSATRLTALTAPPAAPDFPEPATEEQQSWQNVAEVPAETFETTDIPADETAASEIAPPAETTTTTPEVVAAEETPAPVVAETTTPAETVAEAPAAAQETTPAPEVVAKTETAPVAAAPLADQTPVEEPLSIAEELTQEETPAATDQAAAVVAESSVPTIVAGAEIGRDERLPQKLRSVETRAMEGVPEAQHDLATLYASGKGVRQDYKRAAYWFAQAADGNIANAHYNLGVMFQQGLGVKKDITKAIGWYEGAAELGHPEAMYNLGIAYIEGVGTARNIDRGVSFFKQAANAGVAQAAFNLGVLYESGFVGPIDIASARQWYQAAADDGHADAKSAMARLDSQLADINQSLTAAEMIEPAAGEATGQGDRTPADNGPKPKAAKGDALVRKIQMALIAKGFLPAPATGVADAKTEDAIRAWQGQQGLKADGKASPELLEKITQ